MDITTLLTVQGVQRINTDNTHKILITLPDSLENLNT